MRNPICAQTKVAPAAISRTNPGFTGRHRSILVTVALSLIVAFGFLLRFQALIYTDVAYIPHGDSAKYLSYAYNLKNFGIYGMDHLTLYPPGTAAEVIRERVKPDAVVSPGYPLFLSAFLGGEYTGKQFDAARLSQVILSSITILLAYFVFSGFGSVYGLAAAALTAMSPHLINMNLFLLTEPLFCFLLLGAMFHLARIRPESGALVYLAAGLLFGFATLTRPWIIGYALIVALYLVVSPLKTGIAKPALLLIGFLLPIAPWIIRNDYVLGFSADPALTAISVHHGMYPYMMYDMRPETLGFAYRADPKAAELNSLTSTLHELKKRYLENPSLYLRWYLLGKVNTVFSWGLLAAASDIFVYKVGKSPYFSLPQFYMTRFYMEQIHQSLTILSFAGVLLVWLPNRVLKLSQSALFVARSISLLMIYFIILHIIGAPFPRYSIPLRPVTYGMALFPIFTIGRIVCAMLQPGTTESADKQYS